MIDLPIFTMTFASVFAVLFLVLMFIALGGLIDTARRTLNQWRAEKELKRARKVKPKAVKMPWYGGPRQS
jgi:hypothetical protein